MKIASVILVLLIGLVIYVIGIGNSIKESAPNISRSIKESQEVDALIVKYDVAWFSPSIRDSLRNYEIKDIDFSNLEYWIERSWGVEYSYVFFKTVIYSPQLLFLITDPTSLNGENPGPPFIAFKIQSTNQYSATNGVGGAVCIFEVKSIMDEVSLEVMLKIDHSNERNIGDILLRRSTPVWPSKPTQGVR